MNNKSFNSVLVIGIGLIGGSILKSLSESSFMGTSYGLDLNEDITKKAHSMGLIKNSDNSLEKIDKNCLVVLSVPILSLEEAVNLVKEKLSAEEVFFTDTLSTKSKVLDYLQLNPTLTKRFVLSHPIAGSEKSGLSNSTPSLFEDKLTIISPLELNDRNSLLRVENFWQSLGSKVYLLDPNLHDSIFSQTSHLPHVISYALMNYLLENLKEDAFSYSGGSLEDYTRIASSDPVMWRDIMISNKEQILIAIEGFKTSLDHISNIIESEDSESIQNFLSQVKQARDNLVEEQD
tara:strand:+ start:1276 stop:2148 length:873 start_codon:yes stop_codon:yes gene_type:complete